jgi:small subunit ribosomal protein S16
MKRLGRKHRPFYRICVMDQKSPRNGKAIEEIGTYDPMVKDKSKRVVLALDRVDHWVSKGAQPSEKVAALVRKVRDGNWGTAKAPPPMMAPKEPAPAADEGEAAEAPAEAAAE